MSPDFSDYPDNVRIVKTNGALFRGEFTRNKNVILQPRQLLGDFNAVAEKVLSKYKKESMLLFGFQAPFGFDHFFHFARALRTEECQLALEQIRADVEMIQGYGFKPQLRVHRRANGTQPHLDGGTERLLTVYTGDTTLGWRNEDVVLRRNEKGHYGGKVQVKEGAQAFTMALGDIWRHTGVKCAKGVPFAHAAPSDYDDARLLIVANAPDYS